MTKTERERKSPELIETDFITLEGVQKTPGYYEIYVGKAPLKCGIGRNLRKRLGQRKSSHENGLKWKVDLSRDQPNHCASKRSILTKHLYFDRELDPLIDFTHQQSRRDFLLTRCSIRFTHTGTIEEARAQEVENEIRFRYCGRVICRPADEV